MKFRIVIALLLGAGAAAAQVPLPRERPADIPGAPPPAAEAEPSPCQLRLAEGAAFKPLPPITGPGECIATDVVELHAVMLAEKQRIVLTPPATMRCPMAQAMANWLREDAAPRVAKLGATLRGIENYDSFDCRGRNGIPGAKTSEHGRANALDIGGFKLSNGKTVELTDVSLDKSFREDLRTSACAHFSTILGPGSDGYHESHVHFDLIERRNNYKICEWDVLDVAEAAALAAKKAAEAAAHAAAAALGADIPLPPPRPVIDTPIAARGAAMALAADIPLPPPRPFIAPPKAAPPPPRRKARRYQPGGMSAWQRFPFRKRPMWPRLW